MGEYYSAIKKEQNNAIRSNLAIVRLSKVSQTQEDKYYMHMISFINESFLKKKRYK